MIEKLPKDWEIRTLNDVVIDIIDYRGKTPKKLGGSWAKSGIIALSAMNVKQGQLVKLEKAKFVSNELYQKWMKSEVMQGDILMTSEAPLGETYFIAEKRKICLSQRLFCIRANPNIIHPRFLFYLFNLPSVRKQLDLRGTGTTVLGIRQPDLRQVPISIPPHPTQRKIAAVLSAYDDLIENNTRRIEILEEMAQAIYREWFVEFRFPGHEQVPMVESELGLIPQGWGVKQLGDVTSVITKGTTPTTLGKQFASEGINFIKVQSIDEQGDILDSKLAKIDDKTHELLKRSQLQENDILFSIAGAIGRAATVPKRFLPANTNQALAIIRPLDLSFTPYLYQTLRSSEFLSYSLERVVQTAQANVSLSVLSSAPVIVPMKVILDDFNKNLTPITNLVDVLREKNTNLRQTRDLLLPKLISGEVDVSELSIDTD